MTGTILAGIDLDAGTKVDIDYRARQVKGKEKAVWWERALKVWPAYAGYQKRTTREIPVFVLEEVDR